MSWIQSDLFCKQEARLFRNAHSFVATISDRLGLPLHEVAQAFMKDGIGSRLTSSASKPNRDIAESTFHNKQQINVIVPSGKASAKKQ